MQPGRSRVVVIGASLAGLFAAAAAAEHADPILVVERDRVPATPAPRRGVPQGSHQHVLLHRGLIAAEQLLPGLREDLVRAGAVSIVRTTNDSTPRRRGCRPGRYQNNCAVQRLLAERTAWP